MTSATEGSRAGITRRQALKRGAAVGAIAAWTVPTIQVVSLTAAHADSPSAPPNNPPPDNPPPNTPPVTPPTGSTTKPKPPASTPPAAGAGGGGGTTTTTGTTAGGKLAETGLSLPLVPTVAVAAGMIATGIAAQAARPQPQPIQDTEDPAE